MCREKNRFRLKTKFLRVVNPNVSFYFSSSYDMCIYVQCGNAMVSRKLSTWGLYRTLWVEAVGFYDFALYVIFL